jgi:2-methylcitrate dehydratase PrpD
MDPMSAAHRLDETLPAWVAGLRIEDIPAQAVACAKRTLLDTLAVAWAGSAATGVAPVLEMLAGQGGARETSLWTDEVRLPAASAAFGNGLLASALDFDSVHDEATIHPDIVLVPALLALAERGGFAGREFIAAHVAGSEMAVRLGLAVQSHPGWFYSSVLGVIAAAAACARLLGLGADGVRTAAGVALSRAAGSQQALVEGSFTKRLQTAFAARDGVEAALLAQCGITAPRQLFGGRAGVAALYTGFDADKALSGLGRDWRFTGLTIKNYPSCFCNHAAILAAQDIVRNRPLAASQVRSCTVTLTPFSARLVGGAFTPEANPQGAAQFSVRYSVASVLLRGEFRLAHLDPEAVMDPEVLALARRIEVVTDDSASGKFTPATVEVRVADGAERRVRIDAIPGTPVQPLGDGAVLKKAQACFAAGVRPLPPARVQQLVERIDRLETLDSLSGLWKFD